MGARRRTAPGRRSKPRRRTKTIGEKRARTSLVHEVQIYQDQLQLQNEQLIRAQEALEESRDRLAELYDFAPNAYVSLDPNGVIVQINLTGAQMLGAPRQRIEGLPLLGFMMPESRARFLDFLRMCRAGAAAAATKVRHVPVETEVLLRTAGGPRDVQMICRPGSSNLHSHQLLTAIIDVSERRQLESERTRVAREHAALASRLLSAQDEERQRIARDLHDHVGQQVTALRLMLQVAEMQSGSQDVRSRLGQAQSIVEYLDRQLDFIAAELRPASLDLGLASAVQQFVREWSSTFGIAADCHCRGMDEVRLPRDLETHMYRVVQEALNNVYKHAKANRVSVLIENRHSHVQVIVEDDGHGFDQDGQSRQPHGLGLLGMRERAQLVGGTCEIESSPQKGTAVYLRVPIADRTESR